MEKIIYVLEKRLVEIMNEIRNPNNNKWENRKLLEEKMEIDDFLKKNKNSKTTETGYNGYFPPESVVKFHNFSYGIINGYADIRVFIKDGEYVDYAILVSKNGWDL